MDRYAAVNSKLLALNNLTCIDYTYNKTLESYLNTSWDSEAAAGG